MLELTFDESPANVIGLLANLYCQEGDSSQVSSSSLFTPKTGLDTRSNSLRQNITYVLAKEPNYIRRYWLHDTQDTRNILDEQLTTINFCQWFYSIKNQNNIYYRNQDAVFNYLNHYPEIRELINESWADLINFFGESVSIILEVMDHNENEHYEELIGWIQSSDNIDEGLDKFDLFLDKWLDRQLEITGDKFNFNIEFK